MMKRRKFQNTRHLGQRCVVPWRILFSLCVYLGFLRPHHKHIHKRIRFFCLRWLCIQRTEIYTIMKKVWLLLLAFAFGVYTFAQEVTITKVQQRYPWNGLVDIEYNVSEDLDIYAFTILVIDKNTSTTYKGRTFNVVPPTTKGTHKIIWNTIADGYRIYSDNLEVLFEEDKEPLYMVVDLSGGTSATTYPITYMAAPPINGWTDDFKTKKLVLRRIKAGIVPVKNVVIEDDFWIGIFEVTRRQYYLVTGTNPSKNFSSGNNEGLGFDKRPVNNVSGKTICVGDSSFINRIKGKTGLEFNLPTSIQWEYACRAGSDGKYDGCGWIAEGIEGTLANMAWYDCAIHQSVGTKTPNMWELYDMHGNVSEYCLTDISGSSYKRLGGCIDSNQQGCSLLSDFYDNMAWSDDSGNHGFRIFLPIK